MYSPHFILLQHALKSLLSTCAVVLWKYLLFSSTLSVSSCRCLTDHTDTVCAHLLISLAAWMQTLSVYVKPSWRHWTQHISFFCWSRCYLSSLPLGHKSPPCVAFNLPLSHITPPVFFPPVLWLLRSALLFPLSACATQEYFHPFPQQFWTLFPSMLGDYDVDDLRIYAYSVLTLFVSHRG